MKDAIREYFKDMLDMGIEIEGATENLQELVEEIANEFRNGDE